MSALPPDGFQRPDPNAFTQPIPAVARPPYAPTFGNLGAYAFTRFAALVVDFCLVPCSFACFAFNLADRGTLAFAPRTSAGFGALVGIAFVTAIVFAILFESIFETTIGKALFGLGVRRGTGQHAGMQRIVVRYVLLPIDVLLIGEILALVTRRHQRLGDLAAGTVVARHRSGGFVTAFAVVLLAGLIYAQASVGGGLGSLLAVTAEGSYFIPTLVGGALADIGVGARPATPAMAPAIAPAVAPAVAPATEPTDASAPPSPVATP